MLPVECLECFGRVECYKVWLGAAPQANCTDRRQSAKTCPNRMFFFTHHVEWVQCCWPKRVVTRIQHVDDASASKQFHGEQDDASRGDRKLWEMISGASRCGTPSYVRNEEPGKQEGATQRDHSTEVAFVAYLARDDVI